MDYIKHKSYTLLLPFVCYSTIVAFLMYFIGQLDVIDYIKSGLGDALWFIPILFMASALVRITFLAKKRYGPTLYYVILPLYRI